VVDLGTGTGQAVLRRARLHPEDLVVGVDPDASAMADSSRRASVSSRKGGLPNAMFLVASAEDLPGPLCGLVDEVTIALPWGSLLRGVLTADELLLRNLSAQLKAGGDVEILVSATDRDAAAAGLTLQTAADAERLGLWLQSGALKLVDCRQATESDVRRLSSGWGQRLGIPNRRQAWVFRLQKA